MVETIVMLSRLGFRHCSQKLTQKWTGNGEREHEALSLLRMRKILVLILASGLASGAVANADTATFLESSEIYIDGLYEPVIAADNLTVSAGTAITSMIPFGPGEAPSYDDENVYRLHLEVKEAKDTNALKQVAVCIYDASVLNSEALINANCGTGLTDPTTPENFPDSDTDQTAAINPESAIHMAYLPDTPQATQAIRTVAPRVDGANDPDSDANDKFAHKVFSVSNVQSVHSSESTFAGEEVGANTVRHIEFAFAPASVANKSSAWKIRVTAEYETDDVVEITDSNSYPIDFYGQINPYAVSDARPTDLEYGTIFAGDSVLKEDIVTGQYVSNAPADITLAADAFKKTGSNDLTYVSTTPSDGEVKLDCGPADGALSNLELSTGKVLFADQPANSDGQRDAWLRQDISAHDCELTYGGGADSGEYTNVMTVAVSEAD